MALGRQRRHLRLLLAALLLLTLVEGSNCKKMTCTASDIELRHVQVDDDKHGGDGTQGQEKLQMNSTTGRRLNQMPMVVSVWVFNHCPCMVDNVVIYAPNGFSTLLSGTDERIFSKVREHLFLINGAGPLEPSVNCTSSAGLCPTTSFFYTWYGQIQLKPVFLVPHC